MINVNKVTICKCNDCLKMAHGASELGCKVSPIVIIPRNEFKDVWSLETPIIGIDNDKTESSIVPIYELVKISQEKSKVIEWFKSKGIGPYDALQQLKENIFLKGALVRTQQWIEESDENELLFYKAYVEGYEMKKEEPRFRVKVKNAHFMSEYIHLNKAQNKIIFQHKNEPRFDNGNIQVSFTREELKQLSSGTIYDYYSYSNNEFDPIDLILDDYVVNKEDADIYEYINDMVEIIAYEGDEID